jgi:hypothetical protein
MANCFAIHATGHALVTLLRTTYPPQVAGRPLPGCTFELLSGAGLNHQSKEGSTRVGLVLYQITSSQHQRHTTPASLADCGDVPLALELHYLLTAWGATPQDEQIALAWAIRQFHARPVLDASILSSEAGWQADEVLQVVPSSISLDELTRIWASLHQVYRPSMAYVVRGLRLDSAE